MTRQEGGIRNGESSKFCWWWIILDGSDVRSDLEEIVTVSLIMSTAKALGCPVA